MKCRIHGVITKRMRIVVNTAACTSGKPPERPARTWAGDCQRMMNGELWPSAMEERMMTPVTGGEAAYQALIDGGSSGFDAQLGGWRNSYGDFSILGSGGLYWSATERDTDGAWSYYFNRDSGKLYRNRNLKSYGRSCRCVKD